MTHDNFDTQIAPEETQAYSDYVAAEELQEIEADQEWDDHWDSFDGELEDINNELADDKYNVEFEDDFSSFEEMANQFDDSRDFDFYES